MSFAYIAQHYVLEIHVVAEKNVAVACLFYSNIIVSALLYSSVFIILFIF